MFRPTYPPSSKYKNIQTTWEINYITFYKKKISFVHNQKYLPRLTNIYVHFAIITVTQTYRNTS